MGKKVDDEARKLLEIDKHRLDEEWVGQPLLFFSFAERLVRAKNEVDRAKAEIDLVDAELDKAIRLDPETHGLEKVTEAGVKACVLSHKRHQRAHEAWVQAKYEAGVIEAAKEAAEHRKRALEKLVDLHLASYWSEPRARGEAGRSMREAGAKQAFKSRKKGGGGEEGGDG